MNLKLRSEIVPMIIADITPINSFWMSWLVYLALCGMDCAIVANTGSFLRKAALASIEYSIQSLLAYQAVWKDLFFPEKRRVGKVPATPP
ncbi:unnamed protein product [Arctogadus glacialis]